MKPLIIANWKMNPATRKEAKRLFDAIKKKVMPKNAKVVICPSFVYLPLLKGMTLGAQNMFWEEKGAFTGEISTTQLKDLKVEYVILGHSERRKYLGETGEMINKKIKQALDAKLKIIFCIGEQTGDDKQLILEQQLTEGLKNITREQLKHIIITYEPIWAISLGDGRGQNCSVDQTLSSVLLIRKIISDLYNRDLADSMRVIYGGSVNSQNSASYIKEAGVNGLLVGGASLNAEEFIKIVKSTS